jgi:hypothetical protein
MLGPATGLTQEEGSLSALSLLLCRGRNAWTRHWAYTRRGQPFCSKLASLQRKKCFPRLASRLTHKKRAAFLLQASFAADPGMLPGTRLWAYTGRGKLFCFKLASLQKQECFPGLASGLTQEEYSLSASIVLLCRGSNASRNSPLGLHRKRTAFLLRACFSSEAGMPRNLPLGLHRKREVFLLRACFSSEAGMLPGTRLWAYTGRAKPFCFKLACLKRQECFPGLASGLPQEEDSLSALSLLLCRCRNASWESPLGLHRKRTAFFASSLLLCRGRNADSPLGLHSLSASSLHLCRGRNA